jgi:hypothetical protein
MKAAKQYKRQWEEAQLLQLLELAEQTLKVLNFLLRKFKVITNLFLFLSYQMVILAVNIVKIALFAQKTELLVRDEQWIYRQIK